MLRRSTVFAACMPFALALAALVFAPQVQAQAKQSFSAERSWQLQRLGAPSITPDGQKVFVPVTRFDLPKDEGITDIWQWNIDGSGQRQLTEGGSGNNPNVSPDGK